MVPVSIDLSRMRLSDLFQFFLPFLPGVSLVLGAGLVRPDWTASFFEYQVLGNTAKYVVLTVASYLAGVLLQTAIGGFSLWLAIMLAEFWKLKIQPWRATAWRKYARHIAGEGFVPEVEEVHNTATYDLVRSHLETLTNETVKIQQQGQLLVTELRHRQSEFDWAHLYRVFELYFASHFEHYYRAASTIAVIHSTAWVVVLVLTWGGYFNLIVWGVALGAILVSFAFEFSSIADVYGYRMIAAMLREKNRTVEQDRQEPASAS